MTKLLFTLFLSIGFISNGIAQTNNSVPAPRPPAITPNQVNNAFDQMKTQLQIKPNQEKVWSEFVRSNTQIFDASMYQSMAQVKTTPELMEALEKIQLVSAKRFQEQKKAALDLYALLSTDQKMLLDTAMLRLVHKKQ